MDTKTHILIVEHNPPDIELLEYELRKGGIIYTGEIVQTEKDYINALKNFTPDIILSDYTLPEFDGPSAFKIREELAPHIPFVFVSGNIGEENSIEYMRNGVTDYVLKDKLFTLATKVRRALKESEEKQQKNKTEQDLIQSEKRLSRAQQLAHMGSWELDFDTHLILLSDEACRIYGLRPGQNQQTIETWLSFVHPEDLAFVSKKIKKSRDSLLKSAFYHRIIRKDGITRHIYSESKPEFDSSNKATGLYAIAHDVTEKFFLENKLVEERLARQMEITGAVLTAQENEREDIGKELHDNLNQVLVIAKLYLQMARAQEKNREQNLDKSYGYIVDVIEEIRKISKKLIIPDLHINGLFENINNLLEDLGVIHSIKIQFDGHGIEESDLDKKLQVAIFRIVQEQLNNILKHAKATRASITLTKQLSQLILRISDNGEGCDISKEKSGIGIINIKSRAELYRGKVFIVSKPGEGYELKVVLSLNAA